MIHENFISKWSRQFSTKVHKQKLQKIRMRSPQLSSTLQVNAFTKRPDVEVCERIDRENKILYEHLALISERKSPTSLPHSLSPLATFSAKYKKLEFDRITLENISLVARISKHNSELSMKKMVKDYKLNKAYREMISKKNLHERIKRAVNKASKNKLQDGLRALIERYSFSPHS